MKTKLLIAVALFKVYCSFAQINSFAPVGATWYYDHTYFFGSNINDYAKLDAVGDTIIEGKACTVVFIENAYVYAAEFPDSIYLHFDSGKVYRYFDQYDVWGLQYDFNAQAGDTLEIYGMAFNLLDSFPVVVDSVGSININSHDLKTQTYRSLFLNWEYDQKVLEGIGGTVFLFPKYTVAENTIIGLRCYEDSIIGFYNTGLVSSCDTILYLGLSSPTQIDRVTISPTIARTYFNVKNSSDEKIRIDIINSSGYLLNVIEVPVKQQEIISTTHWVNGVYIIKIRMQSGRMAETKLIKLSSS
jgi:hypothetical protein